MNTLLKTEGKFEYTLFPVKVVIGVVMLFTAFSYLRAASAVSQWSFLAEYGMPPLPLYLLVSGAVWCLVGLLCVFGLIVRRRWALMLTMIGSVLFAAWYWVERMLLPDKTYQVDNIYFAVGFTVLALVFVMSALFLQAQVHTVDAADSEAAA